MRRRREGRGGQGRREGRVERRGRREERGKKGKEERRKKGRSYNIPLLDEGLENLTSELGMPLVSDDLMPLGHSLIFRLRITSQ